MRTTVITQEHRARGAAQSRRVKKGKSRAGWGESSYSTSMVIRMNWLRRCPKCDALIRFAKMNEHRKECCAAGADWFRSLPLRDTGGVNIARMAGKLQFMDENDGL